MSTKVVLLGTGTPNAEPDQQGPASAVIVDEQAYLVDFGPGVVRQCSRAYFKGIDALRPSRLDLAFCTHLHSDHTLGLADLIFTPWVLERTAPLRLFGPEGLREMTEHLTAAYRADLDMRLNGSEPANPSGYQTRVTEIPAGQEDCGIIYTDDRVQVEAFTVDHGRLQSLGYRFVTRDHKVIVFSGDTRPLPIVAEKAAGCDLLVHEVEYTAGLKNRTGQWQIYHRQVHTLSTDLASILKQARPGLCVTNHRIYHMEIQDNTKNLAGEMAWRNEAILQEIREAGYDGPVVNGQDLDIFEL